MSASTSAGVATVAAISARTRSKPLAQSQHHCGHQGRAQSNLTCNTLVIPRSGRLMKERRQGAELGLFRVVRELAFEPLQGAVEYGLRPLPIKHLLRRRVARREFRGRCLNDG